MSKSLTIKAVISATSNKQSGKFKTENPRKSLYINCDKENTELLKGFGLTEYTSEDKTAKPFFIIKAGAKLDHYVEGVKIGEVSGLIESPNFTSNGEEVHIALFQEKSDAGKVYTRAYAVNGTIQEVVAQNPFEDLAKF